MSWRPLSLGALFALVLSAPAAGHGRSALFPTLTAAAGHDRQARHVERRVRTIETELLGATHAAAHAQQRVVALRALRTPAARRADPVADNSIAAPDVGGVWAPGVGLPIVAINSILLHTGKVLYFAYPYRPNVKAPDGTTQVTPAWDANDDFADAYVFDPATGKSKQVTPPINPDTGRPAQIFCAGASTLPDGRVLVTGGDVGDPTKVKNEGLNTVYVFDPVTETWSAQMRMRQGRWYPTQLELPDGRTMIMSGAPKTGDADDSYRIVTRIEVFSPNGELQELENFQLKLQDDGQVPGAEPGKTYAPIPGQYPHLFWMPSGHALVAGPRKQDTWRFFPPAAGADDARWEDIPDLPTWRDWAAAVLLPGTAKVMLFGGSDRDDHTSGNGNFPSVSTTTVFDDANPGGAWIAGPAMHTPRAFANAVQLPDGKVAVIGGGSGELPTQYYRWSFTDAQRSVDLFDPLTNAFTKGNAQAEGRTYHSTALLLPDGRVMSAGDDINGPGGPGTGARTDTAEMWSPPYLFDADGEPAARPAITGAPDAVGYGNAFFVDTTDAVSRAVLVAPGASTHDSDMSQRVVPLAAPEKTACGLKLTAPASADLAPPGYYMLFLLNANGTPSKARFVRVGADAPATADDCPGPGPGASPEPTATPTATATPTPTPTPAVKAMKLRVTVAKTRLRRLRRTHRLAVTVTPSRAAAVRIRLTLAGRELVRPRTVTYRTRATRTTRLRLSKAGRRRLRGVERATLTVSVTAVPSLGDPLTVTRKVRLR